jgi:membrane associated rhomboid family serine protease
MIPISDELPSRRVPVITYGLIAINVVVFLFELMLGPNVDSLYMTLGAVPARVTDPVNHPLAGLTLFTSIFIHGGWAHLLGNMLYLWIFGDNVEDILGRVGYTIIYIAAGVAAGLMQIFVAPSSPVPAIGASGAIAGILAIYLVLFPRAPVRVLIPFFYMIRIVRMPAMIVLGMWFIIQLFNGVMSLGTMSVATGGVAWFAHIGGFISGLLVGFVLRFLWRRPPPPRRTY